MALDVGDDGLEESDVIGRGGAPADEPLVGSADVQSLADLANSFAIVRELRLVPSLKESVLTLAVITVLPLAPLPLTVISGSELFERLVKMML